MLHYLTPSLACKTKGLSMILSYNITHPLFNESQHYPFPCYYKKAVFTLIYQFSCKTFVLNTTEALFSASFIVQAFLYYPCIVFCCFWKISYYSLPFPNIFSKIRIKISTTTRHCIRPIFFRRTKTLECTEASLCFSVPEPYDRLLYADVLCGLAFVVRHYGTHLWWSRL